MRALANLRLEMIWNKVTLIIPFSISKTLKAYPLDIVDNVIKNSLRGKQDYQVSHKTGSSNKIT